MLERMIRAKTLDGREFSWAGEREHVWVDASDATAPELAALRAAFPMHPLAAEDALQPGQWRRYEHYAEGDFITFRSLAHPQELDEFTERVTVFLYPTAILTFSRERLPYLDRVWEMVGRESVNSAGEIAFEVLDHGAGSFMTFLEALEGRVDLLEERVFSKLSRKADIAEDVFALKRALANARRIAYAAHDATVLLARHARVPEADLVRFRDVQDTLNRATSRMEGNREALTNLLNIHSGVQSQRMNEVMRTLAAVSTVFLPLTFLAGVWGMNFEHMPELRWPYGYAMAWASFVTVALTLAVYFKRRGWW